jgi:hypothetical protein
MNKKRKWMMSVMSILLGACALMFAGCKQSAPKGDYWVYTFDNETSCALSITPSSGYADSAPTTNPDGTYSDPSETDGTFTLGAKSSKSIWVKSSFVSYAWAPAGSTAAVGIYSTINGSTVVFKER